METTERGGGSFVGDVDLLGAEVVDLAAEEHELGGDGGGQLGVVGRARRQLGRRRRHDAGRDGDALLCCF